MVRTRMNAFPSNILSGRYHQVPLHKRFCLCEANLPSSVPHIILDCWFYESFCRKLLDHLILVTDFRNNMFNCQVLLNDSVVKITRAVAKFLTEILKSNHVLPKTVSCHFYAFNPST